ncbi:MAG TPA: DUF4350 domain-containing protein, partial [Kofleriaceae bacterium]|nr:DUF4350 domain-containing protein [Kofleriaceae bacterium]
MTGATEGDRSIAGREARMRRSQELRHGRRVRRGVMIAALAGLWCNVPGGVGGTARAAGNDGADYDPRSTTWNGMASFVGLAEGMGFEVTPVSSLEWGDLSAEDILVLIYPLQRVDPGRLGAFVKAGGNLVIADDFGEGKDAMQGLGLLRAETVTPRASKYYDGRSYAPIAMARGDHPL